MKSKKSELRESYYWRQEIRMEVVTIEYLNSDAGIEFHSKLLGSEFSKSE